MKQLLLLASLAIPGLIIAQDSCNDALIITTGTYTTGEINGTNTTEGCWDGTTQEGEHAEWYKFTPTQDGIARIQTAFAENDGILGSDNIRVSVYTGSCEALNCTVADGAIFEQTQYFPYTVFEARQGITYYLAFDDFWDGKKLKFNLDLQTPDCITELPFTEKWESHLQFTCWKTYSDSETQKWSYYDVANFNQDPQNDPVAVSLPDWGIGAAKNSWLVSSGLALQAGNTYSFSIKYNAMQYGDSISESFRAVMLNEANPDDAVHTVIGEVTGIEQQGAHVEPYNMDLATTVSYNFTPQADGNYYLGLHANAEDSSDMLIIYEIIGETLLSNGGFEVSGFKVYPNPAANNITVSGTEITDVAITDMNGRKIKQVAYTNVPECTIDIASLQSGIYLMEITSAKGQVIKKIVKQ